MINRIYLSVDEILGKLVGGELPSGRSYLDNRIYGHCISCTEELLTYILNGLWDIAYGNREDLIGSSTDLCRNESRIIIHKFLHKFIDKMDNDELKWMKSIIDTKLLENSDY